MRILKRDIVGGILLAVGLGATIVSLTDTNLVRITLGLLLIATGVSLLFSMTDREAGIHARNVLLGYGFLRKSEKRVQAERDEDN